MKTDMDFKFWAEQYKLGYEDKKKKKHIIKYRGGEEVSPTFENISKVLQKRGYLNHDEFVNICNWKTERPKKHYEHKDNKDILKEVNKKIFPENVEPESKLKELLRLRGVGVPVASALLTVIFPEEYCVIDFRVRQSLLWIDNKPLSFKDYKSFSEFIDNLRKTDTVNSYMRYLGKIKELAQKHKMTPREIEMALWQYDKDKGIKKQMG